LYTISANGKHIASVKLQAGETEGNANLLAAAPDLTAACQDLVDLWAEWAEKSSQLAEPLRRSIEMRVEQARVALAKARGE